MAAAMAVGSIVVEVGRMSIYDELRKLGYEQDSEFGNSEERSEMWVNEKAGMAVQLNWFPV